MREFAELFLVGLLMCGVLPCAAAPTEMSPKNMVLFLLAGQSNMAGRGKLIESDKEPVAGVWKFDQRKNVWVPSCDPVHRDKSMAGVGPASEFAREYVAAHPGVTVGLIPCAIGGSSIDTWLPNSGRNYSNAVRRVRAALANGRLAGILWHQGESDSFDNNTRVYSFDAQQEAVYAEKFNAVMSGFRAEFGSNIPVVVGEIGRFYGSSAAFNAALHRIVAKTPKCICVSSEGLVHRGDKTHFDRASALKLGSRYFKTFSSLTEHVEQ